MKRFIVGMLVIVVILCSLFCAAAPRQHEALQPGADVEPIEPYEEPEPQEPAMPVSTSAHTRSTAAVDGPDVVISKCTISLWPLDLLDSNLRFIRSWQTDSTIYVEVRTEALDNYTRLILGQSRRRVEETTGKQCVIMVLSPDTDEEVIYTCSQN